VPSWNVGDVAECLNCVAPDAGAIATIATAEASATTIPNATTLA
jgi:hypothetical protein